MTSVLLIYPFFRPRRDRSVFRFPPLGIAYIASTLIDAGHRVTLLDCTFLDRSEALQRAKMAKAEVVGIYCMVTLLDDCLWFARELRQQSRLLIAGGPLPTCEPDSFLDDFDVVVQGEGEQTILELLDAWQKANSFANVKGVIYRESGLEVQNVIHTPNRPFQKDLDRLPFPARQLFPNDDYIRLTKKKYGYSITTVMSSRGCPYGCEFCSNVVFGGSYRERSPENVVDEIEQALQLGYDRISFADDVFTMKKSRVRRVCAEIERRELVFQWECLGRVDSIDLATARLMKQAGCRRIYFGIESANEHILTLMNKKITPVQARAAVEAAHDAGLEVGAFFILCYPGDTNETVLETLHFATSLPLDYLGLSMPYPLPGTALYQRVRQRVHKDWHPEESPFAGHVIIFNADFSDAKMWLGLIKGQAQFRLKNRLGWPGRLLLRPFEVVTDTLFRWMK